MTRVLVKLGRVIVVRLSSRLDGVEGSRFRSFTVLGLVAGTPGWLAGGWETPSAADIAGGRRAFAAKFSLQAGPLPCIQL